jgi:hypothetical protein
MTRSRMSHRRPESLAFEPITWSERRRPGEIFLDQYSLDLIDGDWFDMILFGDGDGGRKKGTCRVVAKCTLARVNQTARSDANKNNTSSNQAVYHHEVHFPWFASRPVASSKSFINSNAHPVCPYHRSLKYMRFHNMSFLQLLHHHQHHQHPTIVLLAC